MESPKRRAQKSRDYRRHRMMRLLNRRKATAQKAMSEIAEKELMRKLRITPLKKFKDGKDAEYDAGILDDVVITGNRRPANIMFDKDTGNYYRESTGDVVTPVNKLVEDDPSTWSFADKNGTTFTPHGPVFNSNQGEIRQVEEAPFLSNNYIKQAAHNYMSELAYDINNNRVVSGKYTMPAIALAPVIGSKIGGAAINSAFGAHGLNHAINEGIDGIGDAVTTGLELIPLSQLAKPAIGVAGRAVERGMNSVKNRLPWTYNIPENPNMAYRRMGPLERDWLMEGNELSTRSTNALTEAEEEAARTAATRSGRRFTLFKAGAEHGGRKQFSKGRPWNGTTVTHGEEQILAIPGKDLPWVSGKHFRGPHGKGFGAGEVPFEEAPFGSHIDLLTEEGYTGVNPSLLEGSVIYSPFKIFGRNFGYKKLYPKIRKNNRPLKKFEDGKNALLSSTPKLSNIPKFNFDAPDIEKVVPKYEEIKPAIETPVEPVKQREPIIPGLQPQQQISDSRFSRSHPIFKDEYDYMNSDAFLTRVKKMTNDNEKARILATNMRNNLYHTNLPNKAFYDYTSNSQNDGYRMRESGPYMHRIYYGRVNDVPGFTKRSVIAHELGHSVYETNKNGSLLDYHLLSPQYTSVLQRGRYKTLVDDDTRSHDHQDGERIADIRALQQQAKDAGIWDKTTGVDMTPEMYNKLKQTYPDHRSFDMWNDEDLRWLINTTAQIKPVKNNIYYT